jgi:hypothetical protein
MGDELGPRWGFLCAGDCKYVLTGDLARGNGILSPFIKPRGSGAVAVRTRWLAIRLVEARRGRRTVLDIHRKTVAIIVILGAGLRTVHTWRAGRVHVEAHRVRLLGRRVEGVERLHVIFVAIARVANGDTRFPNHIVNNRCRAVAGVHLPALLAQLEDLLGQRLVAPRSGTWSHHVGVS